MSSVLVTAPTRRFSVSPRVEQMCFVLTKYYRLTTTLSSKLKKGQVFRMTGFGIGPMKDKVVLLDSMTGAKETVDKSLRKHFEEVEISGTEEKKETKTQEPQIFGIPQNVVAGYFEGQQTKTTCWLSCMSNVLLTIQDVYLGRDEILKILGIEKLDGAPGHEGYVEAIEQVLRAKNLPFKLCIFEAGQTKNWPEMLNKLLKRVPIICSVNNRSHVVILLSFTKQKPYLLNYFEPTGGSFKTIKLQDFIKDKSPDWAYSFEKK